MDQDEWRRIIAEGELDYLDAEEDAITSIMEELREKKDWASLRDAEKQLERNHRKQDSIKKELGITW